ncbi:hypothetical protein KC347_g270 [Hortaea werneckii]|nr:hypothetical protein KC347_g270 [Hortaea werneckii]
MIGSARTTRARCGLKEKRVRNAMQAAEPESHVHRSTPLGCRTSILAIKANKLDMLAARLTDLTMSFACPQTLQTTFPKPSLGFTKEQCRPCVLEMIRHPIVFITPSETRPLKSLARAQMDLRQDRHPSATAAIGCGETSVENSGTKINRPTRNGCDLARASSPMGSQPWDPSSAPCGTFLKR